MDISEQFFGAMEVARWIKGKYSQDEIEKVIDKIPYEQTRKVITPHFWTIGPQEDKTGIWLYGQSDDNDFYNFKTLIGSITYIDPTSIVVIDYKHVSYVLNKRCSASSLARTLDCFLRGDYCDIPPINMNDLFELLQDRKEGE